MATTIEDDEHSPLNSSLDERILEVVRHVARDRDGHRTVRPALLAAELGLSVDDATRELCGLLAACGGGEAGASFVFERVATPPGEEGVAAAAASATTMVFTFPKDFDDRAKRDRRRADLRARLHSLARVTVKAIKIFTAFGLIISLAVLIIAGICLLVAAFVALARGGLGGGGGGHRNHPLVHRLRYLFFQLRQILWLYAICGSAVDGQQDPFMREIAGDIAFTMSICCGNPLHPLLWLRAGGMRRRWARVQQSRGWGGRASWNNDSRNGPNRSPPSSSNSSGGEEQRGLLSIAVEFLFGPGAPVDELDQWKFRASVITTLAATAPGRGLSLRELLPYADRPPASAAHPSALRETLRIVSYFNGKPAEAGSEAGAGERGGMEARFWFPELVAETNCARLVAAGTSAFAPPAVTAGTDFTAVLYKEEPRDFGASTHAAHDIPEYLYERPAVLTELSREQFKQCVVLGALNFVGIIWVRGAMLPGGLLALPVHAAAGPRGGRPLVAFASVVLLTLLSVLRRYADLFFLLPLSRLAIVAIRNYCSAKRNARRLDFVRAEL